MVEDLISDDGTCKKCGGALLNVIPGITSHLEIIAFAKNSPAWRDNPDAVSGWMPSGIFCPDGCAPFMLTTLSHGNHLTNRLTIRFLLFVSITPALIKSVLWHTYES
jgi:hypothetical protein